jgi:hypothetical protein
VDRNLGSDTAFRPVCDPDVYPDIPRQILVQTWPEKTEVIDEEFVVRDR